MQWHRNRLILRKICSLGPLPYKAEKQRANHSGLALIQSLSKVSAPSIQAEPKSKGSLKPIVEYWVLQWAACWIHRKWNVPLIQDKVRTCDYHIKKAENWKSEQRPKNISLATSKEFWLAENSVRWSVLLLITSVNIKELVILFGSLALSFLCMKLKLQNCILTVSIQEEATEKPWKSNILQNELICFFQSKSMLCFINLFDEGDSINVVKLNDPRLQFRCV